VVEGVGNDVLIKVVPKIAIEASANVPYTAFSSMNTRGKPLTNRPGRRAIVAWRTQPP